jgi:acid stress-induced BolA-like protein IbaG/YrbA
MIEQIQTTIEDGIPGATAIVNNPAGDGKHFEAIVISPSFAGISLVKQHRAVMNTLKAQFSDDTVHALTLKTYTPDSWAQRQ